MARPQPALSLRLKLVLSYLGVTLGAIFFLAFAIGIAISNYFTAEQNRMLNSLAYGYTRELVEPIYQAEGWLDTDAIAGRMRSEPLPIMLVIVSTHQPSTPFCSPPSYLDLSTCNSQPVQDALNRALKGGNAVEGDFDVSLRNPADPAAKHSLATRYLAMPLIYNNQTIGAMFISTPDQTPVPFIQEVNLTIFLSGIIISSIVVIFSFVLARRFTKPIEQLTEAAEQMKSGQYTRRVPAPSSQDELGILALTFNEMASTIEADVNELRQQEQLRRDLIANIAHDLATPLTAIQGFSEALADEVIVDPQERLEIVQRIGREVQRLRRLVADVQHMTSLESGRARLDIEPLDMHSLVDETLAVIAAECENKGIKVVNEIDPETPAVLVDSDRVTQVLLNLLDNARRHTNEGGTISVRAQRDGNFLQVKVSDTGSGIDPQDLPYIFDRFYRADRSRTTTTGGSGLGLAIVKAIIKAQGGRIWAQSELGQGTTITFTLPLAQTQQQLNAPRQLTKTS